MGFLLVLYQPASKTLADCYTRWNRWPIDPPYKELTPDGDEWALLLALHLGKLPTDCLQGPQREKPGYQLDSAVSFVYLGWLMGLEPTTTGITIHAHNPMLARVCALPVGNFKPVFITCL
jgi:hypothetical protein